MDENIKCREHVQLQLSVMIFCPPYFEMWYQLSVWEYLEESIGMLVSKFEIYFPHLYVVWLLLTNQTLEPHFSDFMNC